MAGLYIHIPFCASRCIYCGFYSTVPPQKRFTDGKMSAQASLEEQYVDALCHEMELRAEEDMDKRCGKAAALSSIYLGGGTPSQLSPQSLQRIFHYIDKVYHTGFQWEEEQNCDGGTAIPMEITMECNPDDVTEAFAESLRWLPVNRISMGAQTFSDERLRFLHRRHTADEVGTAVKRLRRIGIRNISIDLMFGFPNETLAEWEKDIDRAIQLDVEHISAYSLMYEEGTPLYRMLQEGKVSEMDEELYRQMYDTLIDRLATAGYEHYEISNFARIPISAQPASSSPFRSRHNSSYWHNVPYIGIGAAAHSYGYGTRSWNVADIKAYIAAIRQGKIPKEEETIDADTHYNDTIMTALRTREGIRLTALSTEYRAYLMHLAKPFLQQGLLREDDGCLRLTREGIYVSDAVMSELMKV
ncbi:MAG: radical SAM family heme chaperone HemW [Prevotella sp.]|nr:radical SAM family heme chaperone HemW [Prevotella sp.]